MYPHLVDIYCDVRKMMRGEYLEGYVPRSIVDGDVIRVCRRVDEGFPIALGFPVVSEKHGNIVRL